MRGAVPRLLWRAAQRSALGASRPRPLPPTHALLLLLPAATLLLRQAGRRAHLNPAEVVVESERAPPSLAS